MEFPSDLATEQWRIVRLALANNSKRGRKHGRDLRKVVNAMLYVTHTGCQWRFLPGDFGPWTRVWTQFRRWSINGTFTILLAALHTQTRLHAGRAERLPSMVVIDTHLARGASHGGATFHDRGGPYGMTKGAKRVIAVDVTGLPLCDRVVPASTTESEATSLLMADLAANGQMGRLDLVLVDKGTSERRARPLPSAWRVEVAHGQLGRSRRLAKSFENSTDSATAWPQLARIARVLGAVS